MRQHKKHGQTHVQNQIILECGVYRQFKDKDGQTWLKVPSFTGGKMVGIPLNSNVFLKRSLRLIMKEGDVFVHHTIAQKSFAACGDQILGVHKGYSEAYADSEGGFHGTNLGEVLSDGTKKATAVE